MLFGLIKQTGEETVARIKEWFGADYIASAGFGTVNTFIEEFTNALVRSGFGLAGKVDVLYKVVHRIVWSALTYFGMKKLGFPEFAVVGSIIPVSLIGVDLINMLIKRTPEEAGAELAAKLGGWVRTARTSARITVKGGSAPKGSSTNAIVY